MTAGRHCKLTLYTGLPETRREEAPTAAVAQRSKAISIKLHQTLVHRSP